jgi:hypothetical protein
MATISGRTLRLLWAFTVVMIVALAIFTWRLAMRAEAQALLGETVYLNDRGTSISLYVEPDVNSDVAAVLARGSGVRVTAIWNGPAGTWYRVERGALTSGWVPTRQISEDRP